MTIQQSLRSHVADGVNMGTLTSHLLVAADTIDSLSERLTKAEERLVECLQRDDPPADDGGLKKADVDALIEYLSKKAQPDVERHNPFLHRAYLDAVKDIKDEK